MKKQGLLLLMVAFIAFGCSSLKVTSDYDSAIDFSKYKTYKILYFVNEEDAKNKTFRINDINQKRVETSLSTELDMREYSASDKPDVYFLYAFDIDIKKSYSASTTYTGGSYMGYRGRYYGGYGYGGGGSSYTNVDEYETIMGRLRIAMVDAETEELLWIGSASDEVKDNGKKGDEKVAKVINKVMAEFPIPVPEVAK